MNVLPDVLTTNLDVVFCGTGAGRTSALRQEYYAGRGNLFWPVLHEVGLTPVRLRPSQFQRVLDYGIGLTDLSKHRSGSDSETMNGSLDLGAFEQKIAKHAPAVLAFNGKKAAETFLDRAVNYGPQPETIGETHLVVLPSTAATARGYWDLSFWSALASRVKA